MRLRDNKGRFINNGALILKKCLNCDGEFESYKSQKRKYCNIKCKQIHLKDFFIEHCKKLGLKIGKIPWNKGKICPDISRSLKKGKDIKCDFCGKKIHKALNRIRRANNHFCSRTCNIIFRMFRTLTEGRKKTFYPHIFNAELKEQIKIRDNYRCLICGIIEEEHIKKYQVKLSIHHIDHNTMNCKKENLATVCIRHNSIMNTNKEIWIQVFKDMFECNRMLEEYKIGVEK